MPDLVPLFAAVFGLTPLLADGAPGGVMLGVLGAMLLAFLIGGITIAFFVIRGVIRFVRKRMP